jgi:hypothetical protein
MRRLFALSPVVLLVAACSSSADPEQVKTTDGGTVQISAACAADNRKDLYTQGLTKTADDLQLVMLDSEYMPSEGAPIPGPVQKGMNSVTVQILDAAKNPVSGAKVSIDLKMPDHGHGSALVPVVTDQGGGKFQVTNVWLSMAGLWRFTFSVVQDSATKSADFQFCIDG